MTLENHKTPPQSSAPNYRRLFPYIQSRRTTIALALACTLGFTIFWPILGVIVGRIAGYIGNGNVQAIAQLMAWSAGIFILRGLVQFGQDVLMAKAALGVAFDLRTQVYDHLQTLGATYFAKAKTGDLAYRLTEDVDRVGEAINKIFHQFVPSVLQLIVVLGYMVWLNWQLTLATLAIAPMIALSIGWFGERLMSYSRRSQERISDLASFVTEMLGAIRIVQSFAAEDYGLQRFSAEADRARQIKFLTAKTQALQFVVVGFLEAMGVLLIFFLGGWQISQGNLSGSGFASYVAGIAMLIDPISLVSSNYNEFKQSEASIDRLFELLAIPPDIVESPQAIAISQTKGHVTYHNVSLTYPNSNEPALKHISLDIPASTTIALVGSSGAGKSSLVHLLPRFFDPQQGKIAIDGRDVRDFTLSSLRHQIGIVPQDTILLTGSIAENIAFGQMSYDRDQVITAAKIANAHQFIEQFPQGYETWVGERGVNLSGGQRQRIAIARAVLHDPRILILDEATSALDSESEALVQQALDRIMEDRTVLIVAHRLATIRRADRILVLERGRIIESGTHDSLLAAGQRYAAFHAQQFS
ncbi:MAG: ABC transporter ATP-binding protein [Coleofasciculaceae cyanobacterium RL_1_1]|nr:ABC transporter ATP-binding protein [Coleofasciculaceae cyanobacterium RL_1_1]